MSNDYTLPPVPEWAYEDVRVGQVKAYGHAVAAPLLERIAELEAELAQVSGYCETLTQRCVDDTAENGRLRAEVEALTAANAALVASNDALRADAERYRWAQEHTRFENDCEFWMPSVMAIDFKPGAELNGMHATLDAAIDAARKGATKEPTPE